MQQILVKTEKISIQDALSRGWQGTQQQFLPLLGVIVTAWAIPLTIGFVCFLLGLFIPKDQSFLDACWKGITGIICFIVGMLLEMGMIRVQLKVLDGFRPRVADLFEGNHNFVKFITSNVCYNFLTFWGYLMLFVPGLIISLSMQFAPYFIVDKEIGPIESLRASWIASRKARVNLFLVGLLFHFMQSLGFLVLFIGLIPINMIISLAKADLYKQLLEHTSPEELAGVEGLAGCLQDQEDFDRTHKIMFNPSQPIQAAQPAQPGQPPMPPSPTQQENE